MNRGNLENLIIFHSLQGTIVMFCK